MNINQLVFCTIVSVSLIAPIPMLAADSGHTEGKSIEYQYGEDDFAPCGVAISDEALDLLPPPKTIKVGEISYISGGICIEGVRYMKHIAKDFPLELVFVEKNEDKEGYIADVKVNISDNNNTLLEVSVDGPYLLVNLAKGKYLISAEYNGVVKERRVNIGAKHVRTVFLWPMQIEGNEN